MQDGKTICLFIHSVFLLDLFRILYLRQQIKDLEKSTTMAPYTWSFIRVKFNGHIRRMSAREFSQSCTAYSVKAERTNCALEVVED